MYEMKPEYYIGIDMIDEEHKQILSMRMKHMNYFMMSLPLINMIKLMSYWRSSGIIR